MSEKLEKNTKNAPPIVAQWILSFLVIGDERSPILNDFSEIFEELVIKQGRSKALRWYWLQVLKSIPMLLKNQTYWRATMFKNYIKIAIRNTIKNKGYIFVIDKDLANFQNIIEKLGINLKKAGEFKSFHPRNTGSKFIKKSATLDEWKMAVRTHSLEKMKETTHYYILNAVPE